MNGATLSVPASVRTYLADTAVRAGVDALLANDLKTLPEGLEYDEYAQYLTARAAAELTGFDWTRMLWELWTLVWNLEADGWRTVPFDDLVKNGCAVTPAACGKEKRFWLYHSRGDQTLYTAVSVTRKSTEVGFSLENSKLILVQGDDNEFKWRDNGIWNGWFVASIPCLPSDPAFTLDNLLTLTESAMNRVRRVAK